MVTKNKQEQIFIGIDDQIIELTGAEKEAFIADREAIAETNRLIEAEQTKKKEARENAIKKLAEIAGLTDEEINAII
jgi:hypothetical protein